ncbi:MAG TPA: MlaD family protein [Verrucomicrobiota bacterium]|nr:MlaD family protein [Verrucomicrobiota bacterium]HNT13499.1 MlaD family protein [Verrucomicrobiota bacterium]
MKNSLETRLGLFVALIVVAAFFIMFILGGFEKFSGGLRVEALFKSVQELKLGDRVKMAGVEVGTVEKILLAPEQNKVRVIMRLHPNAPVKTDTIARIQFAGLMGQNFVALQFGSETAPLATEGTQLNTVEQPDLGAIMQKLDNVATGVENLTKSFTGDKIDSLFGPLIGFIQDNRTPLTQTISNLSSTSAQIAAGKGTIGRLIFDETLYTTALNTISNLQSTGDEIKSALGDANQIIRDVNSGQGTIGKLIKDEALYNETTASMVNLKEILEKINHGQGTIGKLVNEQEFYRNAKLTLQKVDKMTEGLEDQGPLSVLGILAGNLF